jgi:hypothetical protein
MLIILDASAETGTGQGTPAAVALHVKGLG